MPHLKEKQRKSNEFAPNFLWNAWKAGDCANYNRYIAEACLCACATLMQIRRSCFRKKRNEIRLMGRVASTTALMNCQTSECPRFVLLLIIYCWSDFRIINVLVLPTNQKPLLQRTQVTRSALSPFTSLENCPVSSRFRTDLLYTFNCV